MLIFKSKFGLAFIAVLMGFVVGSLILKLSGFSPIEAYTVMLNGLWAKPSYVANTIIRSTPLVLTGLSVAFAFRTGMFNIGAEGQFIIGAMVAAVVGYFIDLPPLIQVPVVFLMAIIAAGMWGGVAGFLKARFGVHEVLSTIMLNWIAFYLQNYVVMLEKFHRPDSETSEFIQASASITFYEQWKVSDVGREFLAAHPFWQDLLRTPFNGGILVAIVSALVVAYILNKTTLGYQLRIVGGNPLAAECGGINVKQSLMVSMFSAGVLAGAAGALHVMGVSKNISILATMEGYGFDGIAVALIGANSSLGVVLAGFFLGALKYSGAKIQSAMDAPSDVITIMIGVIILLVAMPKAMEIFLNTRRNGRD